MLFQSSLAMGQRFQLTQNPLGNHGENFFDRIKLKSPFICSIIVYFPPPAKHIYRLIFMRKYFKKKETSMHSQKASLHLPCCIATILSLSVYTHSIIWSLLFSLYCQSSTTDEGQFSGQALSNRTNSTYVSIEPNNSFLRIQLHPQSETADHSSR